MKYAILLVATLGACKWTEFDNIANQAWARSEKAPDVGSTDYALALANGSTGASGGTLAVISGNQPTFSTLNYDSHGGVSVGGSPQRMVVSLGMPPVFVADGQGGASVAAASADGTMMFVVGGPTSAPPQIRMFAATAAPDAATYLAGTTTLVVVAGANLYVLDATMGVKQCSAVDELAKPLAVTAIASDDKNVYAWTRTGSLLRYTAASITTTCMAMGMGMPAMLAPDAAFAAIATPMFTPDAGGFVGIVGSSTSTTEYAVLASRLANFNTGSVFVVDLVAKKLVSGSTLALDTAHELHAATVGTFAGTTYVALGYPNRASGSTSGAGEVDLHMLDTATGVLAATPDESLSDDQPDSNEQFGRGLAVLEYNGSSILAVAAKSEVFAYFRTLVYPETRSQ